MPRNGLLSHSLTHSITHSFVAVSVSQEPLLREQSEQSKQRLHTHSPLEARGSSLDSARHSSLDSPLHSTAVRPLLHSLHFLVFIFCCVTLFFRPSLKR